MKLAGDVNFEELARSTDEFNAAQLKAVCVEAGMIALREGATKLSHEHFHSGIAEGTSFAISVHYRLAELLIFCDSTKQEEKRPRIFRIVFFSDGVAILSRIWAQYRSFLLSRSTHELISFFFH